MPPPPPPPQPRAGGFPQSHPRTLHDDPYLLCWGGDPKTFGAALPPRSVGPSNGAALLLWGCTHTDLWGHPMSPPRCGTDPKPSGIACNPKGCAFIPPKSSISMASVGLWGSPPPKVPSWLDSSTRKWGFTVPQTNTAGRGWRAALWSLLADIRVSFRPRCCARGTDGSGQVIKA